MTARTLPIRRLFRVVNGGTPTADLVHWGGDVPWATPADFTSRLTLIGSTRRTLTPAGVSAGSATVPPGSLLISTRAPIGSICITGTEMAFNQGCRALVPKTEVDVKYFGYQLEARASDLRAEGLGTTFPELSSERLAAFNLIVPPLEEQRRIVDFLDAEIARIELLNNARAQQVALATSRLEALAKHETGRNFVRGVDPRPALWHIHPLRRAIKGVRTGTTPASSGPDLWIKEDVSEAVQWYGPSSFEGFMNLGTPVRRLPGRAVAERVVPSFPKGSILIVGIGATAGKVAYLDHDATGNQQITAVVPKRDVSGRFLAWQLWAAASELRELAPYTTLPIINNDFLKSFPVAVPPFGSQVAIAQKLDSAAARTGALQEAAHRTTSLAQERRQALISAAVTGQFDVSTASGRNVTEGVAV